MADGEYPKRPTQAQHQEPSLSRKIIRIVKLQCMLVVEDALRLLKWDAVLLEIVAGLSWVPDDAEFGHPYIVLTRSLLLQVPRCVEHPVEPRRPAPVKKAAMRSPAPIDCWMGDFIWVAPEEA